jgi:hypothetical protein
VQQTNVTRVALVPPISGIVTPKDGESFTSVKSLDSRQEALDHNGVPLGDSEESGELRRHPADHFHVREMGDVSLPLTASCRRGSTQCKVSETGFDD